MDPEFMAMLQAVRSKSRIPMQITSGYRCPEHNAAVSTTGRSGPHTTGKAADIACHGGDAYRILKFALAGGFTGIGVQQQGGGRFLHLDSLRGAMRPWIWSY